MPFLLLLLSNPGLHHSVRRLHHTRSGHPETMWRWRIHSGSYFQRTWTTSGVHNLSVRYVQQSKDQFTLAARFPARGKFEHHCTLSITFQSQSFGFRFSIYFCFIILSFSSSIGQKTKCTIITIPHLTESSDWIENLCISLSLSLSLCGRERVCRSRWSSSTSRVPPTPRANASANSGCEVPVTGSCRIPSTR